MRIIANENIASFVITGLRSLGYDVVAVREVMRGATDSEVLARSHAEQRLLLTHDKDFGELAFMLRLPVPGVILFRLSDEDPEAHCQRMLEVIQSRSDWLGHFSVVDEHRIRLRTMPHAYPNAD